MKRLVVFSFINKGITAIANVCLTIDHIPLTMTEIRKLENQIESELDFKGVAIINIIPLADEEEKEG